MKITGILRTRENNSMSLSCVGEMEIKNNVVEHSNWHGYPRTNGRDAWTYYYGKFNTGDKISQEEVDKILSFNGRNNIVSSFTKEN